MQAYLRVTTRSRNLIVRTKPGHRFLLSLTPLECFTVSPRGLLHGTRPVGSCMNRCTRVLIHFPRPFARTADTPSLHREARLMSSVCVDSTCVQYPNISPIALAKQLHTASASALSGYSECKAQYRRIMEHTI
jgi:hypothetical protein